MDRRVVEIGAPPAKQALMLIKSEIGRVLVAACVVIFKRDARLPRRVKCKAERSDYHSRIDGKALPVGRIARCKTPSLTQRRFKVDIPLANLWFSKEPAAGRDVGAIRRLEFVRVFLFQAIDKNLAPEAGNDRGQDIRAPIMYAPDAAAPLFLIAGQLIIIDRRPRVRKSRYGHNVYNSAAHRPALIH